MAKLGHVKLPNGARMWEWRDGDAHEIAVIKGANGKLQATINTARSTCIAINKKNALRKLTRP